MSAQEGFYSLSFYCGPSFGQSLALLPNLPQPPLDPGFPLGQLATGLLFDLDFSILSFFVFVCRTKWGQPSSLLHTGCWELEPTEKPCRDCKQVLSIFSTLPLASVPSIAPLASLFLPFSGELSPSLPGFSAFISTGNDFLSLSTKAQEEVNWRFIHRQPQCGVGGSGSRRKCSPKLTEKSLPTKNSCCCHWNA